MKYLILFIIFLAGCGITEQKDYYDNGSRITFISFSGSDAFIIEINYGNPATESIVIDVKTENSIVTIKTKNRSLTRMFTAGIYNLNIKNDFKALREQLSKHDHNAKIEFYVNGINYKNFFMSDF